MSGRGDICLLSVYSYLVVLADDVQYFHHHRSMLGFLVPYQFSNPGSNRIIELRSNTYVNSVRSSDPIEKSADRGVIGSNNRSNRL